MQTIKQWQENLHAAFKKLRPRNVRFQMLTDYVGRKVGLWREGGTVPADCRVEIGPQEQWFGFEAEAIGDVDAAGAESVLAGLFAKFDKPHKKGK